MKYKQIIASILFISFFLSLFLFNNYRVSAAGVNVVDKIRVLVKDASNQWVEIQDGDAVNNQQAIRVEVYWSDQSLATYTENGQAIDAHDTSNTPIPLAESDAFNVHLNTSLSVVGAPILNQPLSNGVGVEYAHYDVTGNSTNGYDVVTTFTNTVESQQNLHGWYFVETNFSNASANGGSQDIVIDVAGNTYTFSVNAQPIPKAYINFKSNSFTSDKNGIKWSVYINVNNRTDAGGNPAPFKQDLTDFTFTDTVDENQRFVHGSFVVQTSDDMQANNNLYYDLPHHYKSYKESDGDFTVTYSDDDTKATLNLGNMVGEQIACVVYNVSLTNSTLPYYENSAVLSKIGEVDDVIHKKALNSNTGGGASGVDSPTIEKAVDANKVNISGNTLAIPNLEDRFYFSNNVTIKANVTNYNNVTISDTLEDVLEPTNVWVECAGQDISTLGNLVVNGQEISFEMNRFGAVPFDFNPFSGKVIQLIIEAKVKENAELYPYLNTGGTIKIPNTGKLTFNGSSTQSNTVNVSVPFQAKIIKVDASDNHKILDGALFQISKGSFSLDVNGNELFALPEKGTYTLVEVASPDGYLIDGTPKTIEINPDQSNHIENIYTITVANQPASVPTTSTTPTTSATPSTTPSPTTSTTPSTSPTPTTSTIPPTTPAPTTSSTSGKHSHPPTSDSPPTSTTPTASTTPTTSEAPTESTTPTTSEAPTMDVPPTELPPNPSIPPSDSALPTPSPMLSNNTESSLEEMLPDNIPEGYRVIPQEEPGLYYVYDENNILLGYVQLQDGETPEDITMGDLVSLKKSNPKTYDINRSILLLAFLSSASLIFYLKNKKSQKHNF